jgi:hypothetical protein
MMQSYIGASYKMTHNYLERLFTKKCDKYNSNENAGPTAVT